MAGVGFLKKGKAAHQMLDKADAEAEARKEAANQVRRYWMPPDKENQITFLDGELDSDGMLEATSYWEHNLKLNGHWRNWFPCTQVQEPCPICDGGDSNAALVSVFTVIDHGQYTDGKGVKHQHEIRLFACKREVFRRLQKIAAKRGGLKGCTFDVSRVNDKSAGCGDVFEFVEKQSIADIKKKYKLDDAGVKAIDYNEAIVYRTAKELNQLGFGEVSSGSSGKNKVIGSEDGEAAESGSYADDDVI